MAWRLFAASMMREYSFPWALEGLGWTSNVVADGGDVVVVGTGTVGVCAAAGRVRARARRKGRMGDSGKV